MEKVDRRICLPPDVIEPLERLRIQRADARLTTVVSSLLREKLAELGIYDIKKACPVGVG